MGGRARRGVLWALLGVFALGLAGPLVSVASAEDEEKPAASSDGQDAGKEMDAFEDRILRHPVARVALLAARFVPIVIGVGLLIAAYLRFDRIRGGALPAPPRVVLSTPLDMLPAILLTAGAMLLVPGFVLVAVAVMRGGDVGELSLGWQMGASAAGSLPLAAIVLLRRGRNRIGFGEAPASEAVAEVFGEGGPPPLPGEPSPVSAPTRPPRLSRALALGGWTFCVAAVIVTPLALAWALVLDGMGVGAEAQDLVVRVVDPQVGYEPWLILFFGVFVAPFVEECIFRGMLYPAAKRALGGGPKAAWIAALAVSGAFAAIHLNWLAFVPLFALAMVLTWIFERTNSLAACIFAHAIHNGVSLVPLLLLRFA